MPCVYVCVIIGGIYCPLFQTKYLQGFHLSADIPLSFYFGWLAEYVWWTERNRGNLFWNGLYFIVVKVILLLYAQWMKLLNHLMNTNLMLKYLKISPVLATIWGHFGENSNPFASGSKCECDYHSHSQCGNRSRKKAFLPQGKLGTKLGRPFFIYTLLSTCNSRGLHNKICLLHMEQKQAKFDY